MDTRPREKTMYVFTGPTLSPEEGREHLDAIFLGPAAQGDVYAALRTRPWAIGIVDGYFERIPAVWHKEILWAMREGVHVFGSASMGALRAAELSRFGMVGVGSVYEAFESGALEDDDEVTVVHGPPESGYTIMSDAMVNIRATLEAAPAISASTRDALLTLAKELHYRERRYDDVLARARVLGLPVGELDALAKWLPQGQIDQKKQDALSMLKRMREHAESEDGPMRVPYHFQHTDAWEKVRRMIDQRPLDTDPGAETYVVNAVTDELRLRPDELQRTWSQATMRALALKLAWADGGETNEEAFSKVVAEFCTSRGLTDGDKLREWMATQSLEPSEFTELMESEALVERALTFVREQTERELASTLRLQGNYSELAARARLKEQTLVMRGLDVPSLARAKMSESELWQWYFEKHLGVAVPESVSQYARDYRFSNIDSFRQAVLREYFFAMSLDEGPSPTGSANEAE